MTEEIHSCSFYCMKPACILAQRDALVKQMVTQNKPKPEIKLSPQDLQLELYLDFGEEK